MGRWVLVSSSGAPGSSGPNRPFRPHRMFCDTLAPGRVLHPQREEMSECLTLPLGTPLNDGRSDSYMPERRGGQHLAPDEGPDPEKRPVVPVPTRIGFRAFPLPDPPETGGDDPPFLPFRVKNDLKLSALPDVTSLLAADPPSGDVQGCLRKAGLPGSHLTDRSGTVERRADKSQLIRILL